MIREIKIKAALNGYVANVGCQTLVFNSRADMLKELDGYLEKPDETEKRYRETAVNRELLNSPQPAECAQEAPRAAYPTPAAECGGTLGGLVSNLARR